MDWPDLDFIADVPPESDWERECERTGWEVVVFILEDEDDED